MKDLTPKQREAVNAAADAAGLPADPENDKLDAAREGIHVTAVLMGCLRRELMAEGFEEDKAVTLCEAWMLETLPHAAD